MLVSVMIVAGLESVSYTHLLLDIIGADVAGFYGDFDQRIIVGRRYVLYVCGRQPVKALLQAIGENRRDTQDFRARFAQHIDDVDAAAAGGDQIFDDDDLRPRLAASLNLIRCV